VADHDAGRSRASRGAPLARRRAGAFAVSGPLDESTQAVVRSAPASQSRLVATESRALELTDPSAGPLRTRAVPRY
jgi:hypothetical protein